ncbi:class I SAM-dependent methyltransferase [Azospirillum thiophilum]|nr:class I SAM-dependent methyltransferase [Azospirillum thiophilum]
MNMREADIRPQQFDDLRMEARARDVAWLRSRHATFAAANCPACQGRADRAAYEKLGFRWDRCGVCATAFMNPRPSPETLAEFYARSELYRVWNDVIFPATRDVRRTRIFRPRMDRLLDLCVRHGLAGGCLVEVGAAHGILCEEAGRTGRFSRVIAIEPSAVQAQTCRDLGIETLEAPVESVCGLDGVADVVAAFEVVEHLSDPAAAVRAMTRLLKPGGLLMLSTPNVDGFEIATLDSASDSVYPEHVTLFTPIGMRRMVEDAGLALVELSTPGQLDADIVRGKAMSGVLDLSTQPFLHRVLVERWEELGGPFQSFLAASGQSSHMWCAARRVV